MSSINGTNTHTTLLREVQYDANKGLIYLNNGQVVQRFGGEVINGAYLQPIDSTDEWEIEAEYVDRTSETRIYEVRKPEDPVDDPASWILCRDRV